MWESSCSINTHKTNLPQFFLQWWRLQESNFVLTGLCQGGLLERFRENNLPKVSLLKSLIKRNLLECLHYLCNLVEMDAYSNDFPKNFLAKNPCDWNRIRSTQIVASVNALNRFHF